MMVGLGSPVSKFQVWQWLKSTVVKLSLHFSGALSGSLTVDISISTVTALPSDFLMTSVS